MRIAAIIVAGGQGSRAGSERPKQLRDVAGKPVFAWSVDAFDQCSQITEIVVVVPAGEEDAYAMPTTTPLKIVTGGDTRTESVKAGLAACRLSTRDCVMIHDAARPGLSQHILEMLIDALDHYDAAAPALVVADALKKQNNSQQLESVARDGIYRVQTPQAFRYGKISKALSKSTAYVDDLAAIEAQKGKVKLIKGSEALLKITFPEDFRRAEMFLAPPSAPRIGTGYDVHAFEPGDGVTLCGVKLEHTAKLAGHSDADVAWHALTDAILGAAAMGDIGDHFPPSDPRWKNADSGLFLQYAIKLVREQGWTLENCDITLICEAPKIKPHRDRMRQRTSEITGLSLANISVKATTTEGLGFTGRKEGIAAQAAALLSPITKTA